MPVQVATTLAMSPSVTSSLSRPPSSFCILLSFSLPSVRARSASGSSPYVISEARVRSPILLALSLSSLRASIFSCSLRTASRTSFSLFHLAIMEPDFSFRSARSLVIFSRRALLSASSSFTRACRSISSCMASRSIWSISVGMESSSILSRAAASSTRSTALSGRKRSEI